MLVWRSTLHGYAAGYIQPERALPKRGAGKLKVLFNSMPIEFKPESVTIEVNGQAAEIPNDFVWILAGGTPPNDFLKKIGVEFGSRDVTLEASSEVKQASLEQAQIQRTMSARAE